MDYTISKIFKTVIEYVSAKQDVEFAFQHPNSILQLCEQIELVLHNKHNYTITKMLNIVYDIVANSYINVEDGLGANIPYVIYYFEEDDIYLKFSFHKTMFDTISILKDITQVQREEVITYKYKDEDTFRVKIPTKLEVLMAGLVQYNLPLSMFIEVQEPTHKNHYVFDYVDWFIADELECGGTHNTVFVDRCFNDYQIVETNKTGSTYFITYRFNEEDFNLTFEYSIDDGDYKLLDVYEVEAIEIKRTIYKKIEW